MYDDENKSGLKYFIFNTKWQTLDHYKFEFNTLLMVPSHKINVELDLGNKVCLANDIDIIIIYTIINDINKSRETIGKYQFR